MTTPTSRSVARRAGRIDEERQYEAVERAAHQDAGEERDDELNPAIGPPRG